MASVVERLVSLVDAQKVFSGAWIQARREGHDKYSASNIARKAVEAFRAQKRKPMFFTVIQNNSKGVFDYDEKARAFFGDSYPIPKEEK